MVSGGLVQVLLGDKTTISRKKMIAQHMIVKMFGRRNLSLHISFYIGILPCLITLSSSSIIGT